MYQPYPFQTAPPSTFIEHYSALNYILTDHGSRLSTAPAPVIPVQTIKFDDQQELLWSGNISGHVTSYYSDHLTKYTSFSIGSEDSVLQLLTGDYGVLCLLKDELKLRNRRGVPKFSYSSSTFKDILCMSRLPSQLILLGGLSHNLIEFDLERQRQLRTTELDTLEMGCCQIKQHPKFVCCADLEGRITLRNTNNLAVSHTFKTHTGTIANFDVHGNYLVTCGYPSSRPTPDRFLMVYDLRTFRLVTPIQSIFSPCLVSFIPAFTSKFCLASSLGQFQLLDVAGSMAENCTAFTHQVQLQPGGSLTYLNVSSSGQALAFGDDLGGIHLFGTNPSVIFNQFSSPTEFPDPIEPSLAIDPNDYITPLFMIIQSNKTILPEKSLGDDLKKHEDSNFYKTPKIDEKILESMTNRSDVGYSPNPYRSLGHTSYIKGQVGVVGHTTKSDKKEIERGKGGEDKVVSNNNGVANSSGDYVDKIEFADDDAPVVTVQDKQQRNQSANTGRVNEVPSQQLHQEEKNNKK